MMDHFNRSNGLIPFWDLTTPEDEKARRMETFYAAIYPAWAPIVQRHWEREINDTTRDPAFDFREIDCLHECDLAVKRAGARVDRGGVKTERQAKQDHLKERVVTGAKAVYGY